MRFLADVFGPAGYQIVGHEMLMSKLNDICPDFHDWPDRWKENEQDLEYGKELLDAMRPFAESIAEGALAKKTMKRHLTNLWLLGGEIVRDAGLNERSTLSRGF